MIEQTSGPLSVCPGNETKKAAAANENVLRVWALDQRQATWNRVSDLEEEGFEDTDKSLNVRAIQDICSSGLVFGYSLIIRRICTISLWLFMKLMYWSV